MLPTSDFITVKRKMRDKGLRRLAHHLKTKRWAKKRAACKEHLPRKCYICKIEAISDLHHKTYERLGRELMTDLCWLCRPCHQLVHREAAATQMSVKETTELLKWLRR